jgi:hypothetical protein
MVNFSDRKVIHTTVQVGSKEYESLVLRGYVKVGVLKVARTEFIPLFWDAEYFEPRAKYIHQNNS